jgi:ubiquinone/menaquinone biosynthesis C-methylase UbiE
MAFAYQESDIDRRYDLGRNLGTQATGALMELLRRYAPHPVGLVIDLGCGTGRFTAALAETFHARVVGVEPAANMRRAAAGKLYSGAVSFVSGAAEHVPFKDDVADVVFLSQVLHHVADRAAAFREVRRVLKRGGRLSVRQTTRENLDACGSYFYQRFFPEARAFDERRLPFRAEISRLARSCACRTIAIETTRHEIAATGLEYVEKIALRAYSDLECISDAAFRNGLSALQEYSAAHVDFPKFAENDLFVFGSRDAP